MRCRSSSSSLLRLCCVAVTRGKVGVCDVQSGRDILEGVEEGEKVASWVVRLACIVVICKNEYTYQRG